MPSNDERTDHPAHPEADHRVGTQPPKRRAAPSSEAQQAGLLGSRLPAPRARRQGHAARDRREGHARAQAAVVRDFPRVDAPLPAHVLSRIGRSFTMRRLLAAFLLIAAPLSARVISYAPYSDRITIPAMQHLLNRHFVLYETTPANATI